MGFATVVTRAARLWSVLLIGLLLCLTAMALPQSRDALLRSAGRALVAGDAIGHADAIVISSDSGAAGVLEAADLFHAGAAPRIAVFSTPSDPAQRELRHRGIPFDSPAALSIQLLHALGVTAIEQLPDAVEGTADEGAALHRWCTAHSFHTIIFVSTADHSRRTRRVLHRALAASGTHVEVRYARYSAFDPDGWWHSRDGQRTQITESEKLLLDFLAHPLSW
ncbi:MAG TPA: hypothetical protein VIY54_04110 [Steroidobacteraceae bacterium]